MRRLTPVLEEVLPWVACYRTVCHAVETLWKEESVIAADFVVFWFQEGAAAVPALSSHDPEQSAPAAWRQDPPPARRVQLVEGSDDA